MIEIKELDISSVDDQVVIFAEGRNENYSTFYNRCVQKHYKNPNGNSIIFGAYLDNKLVGVNAFMPVEYRLGERIIKVLQSCDTKVLEECRGKGIWKKIMISSMEILKHKQEYDFIIGFPNYRNSYPGFMKLGWSHIKNMDNYLLINNTANFCNTSALLYKFRFLSRVLDVQKIPMFSYKYSSYKYTHSDLNAPLDRNLYDLDGYSINATNQWMTWRKLYKHTESISIANAKGTIKCFYNIDSFEGAPVIHLHNIYFSDKLLQTTRWIATILHELLINCNEAAYIRIWFTRDNINAKYFRRLGFLKSKHLNPFILLNIKESEIRCLDNDMWKNLSFMDLD